MDQWYVYELRDPTNGEVFYVGKGQGDRIDDHEREAEKAKNNSSEEEEDEKITKLERINKILQKGDEVIKIVIGRYKTEAEALAVESTLMHWVYGHPNQVSNSSLTNIQSGHSHKNIRVRDYFGEVEGLDIDRTPRQTGQYTADLEESNKKYNVAQNLKNIEGALVKHNIPENEIIDKSYRANNPSIYIKIGNYANIQLLLRGSSSGNVIINIRPSGANEESIKSFLELHKNWSIRNQVEDIKGSKNDKYFKLKYVKFINYKDINKLCEIILKIRNGDF